MAWVSGFLILASWVLASCAQDSDRYNEETGLSEGRIVLPRLVAQVDDTSLKALGFTMGENPAGSGKLVPLLTLQDGQTYIVHTALSDGTYGGVASLNWTYHNSWTDQLDGRTYTNVLVAASGQSIPVSAFGEASFHARERTWYITGILGGTLNNGQVTFTPRRELKGLSRTALSGASFDLEVPFAFPWTAVSNTGVAWNRSLIFKPLGSLIGYELGNANGHGEAATLYGFVVRTNAFRDTGYFSLTAPTGGTVPVGHFPEWTASGCNAGQMSYSLSAVEGLPDGAYTAKRYYAWVMPETGVVQASTRIVVSMASSSGPSSGEPVLFASDYAPSTTGSRGVPQQRKAYVLKARGLMGSTYELPSLAQVAEYNLAGGAGTYAYLTVPNYPGLSGPLRMANRDASAPATAQTYLNPHDNNMSGYYGGYIAFAESQGITSTMYNPGGYQLQNTQLYDADGSQILLSSAYYVPEIEDWWSVFAGPVSSGWSGATISFANSSTPWAGNNSSLIRETVCFNSSSATPQRFTASCLYSVPITDACGNQVVYALRFLQAASGVSAQTFRGNTYPVTSDSSRATAFKYTRIGAQWSTTRYFQVEAIFLGTQGYNALSASVGGSPTGASLQTWWNSYAGTQDYPVVRRIFPIAGLYYPRLDATMWTTAGGVSNVGYHGHYWSATSSSSARAYIPFFGSGGDDIQTSYSDPFTHGFTVRLFKR